LFAAGSGANPRNAATLRELEKASGVPVMQRAKDLATAKTFANPGLTPSDYTGKVVGRMALGAGIGYGIDGGEGAAIGGALASPFALKYGINAMNLGRDLVKHVPNFAKLQRENPTTATAVTQLLNGQLKRANPESPEEKAAEDFINQNPRLLDYKPDQTRKPSGFDKWAMNGASKIGLSDDETKPLLQDKRARQLLVEASTLKDGDPKLKRIKEQLSKGRRK
jgi:hypothetical protein